MVCVLALLLTVVSVPGTSGGEPGFQFRTNDVIAFVGGEDVVEMQHNGYFELRLMRAKPTLKLRIRYLALEGDTVFEQHRQLNFPSWEKQLERIGATVVVAQFGQAESFRGTNGISEFEAAYRKLLDVFSAGGRRCVIMMPTRFSESSNRLRIPGRTRGSNANLELYVRAIQRLASERNLAVVDLFGVRLVPQGPDDYEMTRDGLHLNAHGHWFASFVFATYFWSEGHPGGMNHATGRVELPVHHERLRQLILEKNRLWFDYWRPQNWAFLHGDRTEQPSSRDHRDMKKRWFPEEMEKFLPLIEEKEKEIWAAALKLSETR